MKTSDLPKFEPAMSIDDDYLVDEHELSDSYYAVIEGSRYPHRVEVESYLWDMLDVIEDPLFELCLRIYNTYHDQ